MAKDPICNMDIDEVTSQFMSIYGNQTYYFCSYRCKSKFDEYPLKYIVKSEENKIFGLSKHGLIMLLCCLIPVVFISIVLFFGFSSSYLAYLAILLCPLAHIFLMGKHEHGVTESDNKDKKEVKI